MALLSDDPAVADVLALLDEQTSLLLAGVQILDDAAARQPSRLPGWSRGHVLTHLARNADGLRGVLASAAAGQTARMYPSREVRDADVEAGARRPADDLARDLEGSALALQVALHACHADLADAPFTSPAGWSRPIRDTPWFRCREVVLHHVDLGIGFGLDAAPQVAARLLAETAELFAGRDGVPGLEVVATDADRSWRLHGGGPRVAGPTASLATWLTGRGDGDDLDAEVPVPPLPPWA